MQRVSAHPQWPRYAFWAALYAVCVVYSSVVLGPLGLHFVPADPAEQWQHFLATPFLDNGSDQRPDWVANLLLTVPLGLSAHRHAGISARCRVACYRHHRCGAARLHLRAGCEICAALFSAAHGQPQLHYSPIAWRLYRRGGIPRAAFPRAATCAARRSGPASTGARPGRDGRCGFRAVAVRCCAEPGRCVGPVRDAAT